MTTPAESTARIDAPRTIMGVGQGADKLPAIYTCAIGKVGPLTYHNADGTERIEHVTREELFDAESMKSALGAVFTIPHPDQFVTDEDYKRHLKGTVLDAWPDGDLLMARLSVSDREARDAIESRKIRELSPGKRILPRNDAGRIIQTGIRYNHVAGVPRGRAGSRVSVRERADGLEALVERADPGIDETENSWRARQREPGEFQADSFRNVDITDGVTAVMGRLKGQMSMTVQSYIFSKERFRTREQVESWLSEQEKKRSDGMSNRLFDYVDASGTKQQIVVSDEALFPVLQYLRDANKDLQRKDAETSEQIEQLRARLAEAGKTKETAAETASKEPTEEEAKKAPWYAAWAKKVREAVAAVAEAEALKKAFKEALSPQNVAAMAADYNDAAALAKRACGVHYKIGDKTIDQMRLDVAAAAFPEEKNIALDENGRITAEGNAFFKAAKQILDARSSAAGSSSGERTDVRDRTIRYDEFYNSDDLLASFKKFEEAK